MKRALVRESDPEEMQPPMALDVFIERVGISRGTAFQWRRKGVLRTVNIYGRQYVPAKEIVEFNRRAAAGEFVQNHKTPDRNAATRLKRK